MVSTHEAQEPNTTQVHKFIDMYGEVYGEMYI